MLANFRRRAIPKPGSRISNPDRDPGCDCDDCVARRRDELNDAAGCGPWMLLIVGYIVALTAIGISLIIISTELAK